MVMKCDLVLEGGGVKGIALVGAIEILDEAGYTFNRVAGTSAGAVVGALVAAGMPSSDLVALMRAVDYRRFQDESWSDMIQLWSSYNLHLLHVIAAIPEATLMRARIRHNLDQIALHPVDKQDPTTLDYFVRDYLVHMKHHLDQIFAPQDS